MLVTVSTTCIIFMVAAFHMRRNDHAWPGVVLWKGEGNHEHLLIACISEQSQEVCQIFFYIRCNFIYIKWSLGQRACPKHSVLAYLSFVNYNGRDFACCRPAFPYTCIITERVLALMVLCSVWPYSQKLTTIQCSQGKALSLHKSLDLQLDFSGDIGRCPHPLCAHLSHTLSHSFNPRCQQSNL